MTALDSPRATLQLQDKRMDWRKGCSVFSCDDEWGASLWLQGTFWAAVWQPSQHASQLLAALASLRGWRWNGPEAHSLHSGMLFPFIMLHCLGSLAQSGFGPGGEIAKKNGKEQQRVKGRQRQRKQRSLGWKAASTTKALTAVKASVMSEAAA